MISQTGSLRILLVISAQPTGTMRAQIRAGQHPRRDHDALTEALHADTMYLNDALRTPLACRINSVFGPFAALAWAAFRRRHEYDILFTDAEIIGLPLALLLKVSRSRRGRPRHVTLAHYLSPLKKRVFFWFGARRSIDTLIVFCAAQYAYATSRLRIPEKRVVKLPYFVDVHFWRPLASPARPETEDRTPEKQKRPMICSPGLEWRDYPTLFRAVKHLRVDVQATAASSTTLYSPQDGKAPGLAAAPGNVTIKSYDFEGLRQLYAAARFIVIPLREVDFQAGITVILEAMAMGKAVIVSGTRGQTDVVRDPRHDERGPVAREGWPGFLDGPDAPETLKNLPTGFYVTPDNPDELRSAIQFLLDHPEVAEELGRNGRRVAEDYFSLEAFTRRFADAILGKL